MEAVTGPWDGIYIIAYTAELEGRFYGYAKLTTVMPEDIWAANQVVVKITAECGYVDEAAALAAVQGLAERWIAEAMAPRNKGFWFRLLARARHRH